MDCIVISKQTAYLKALRWCVNFQSKVLTCYFLYLLLRIFSTISSENLTVDQDKASTLIIIMLFSTPFLLGNLLKEEKRNNMLITLELKKMSASFQNLPT